jgi:hypothetical protein
MKKSFTAYLLIVLSFLLILSGIFYCKKVRCSSIEDNTSQGIVLRSTSRAYQQDCVRATEFALTATLPAVLDDWGIGSVCEFTDATQDVVSAEYRIPLDIDASAQPYLQLQWASPTADPTSDSIKVRWQIAYLWLADDETTDGSAETTTISLANVSTTAKGLVETDVQLSGMTATDERLQVQITRIGDHTSDTNDGQDANLFDACLYYIINKLGEPL